MDRSEQTRLEMEAGAKQLAIVRGQDLPPDYMAAVIRTQERNAQLRRWITDRKVRVRDPDRYAAGTVRYKRAMPEGDEITIEVLPDKGGPTFTDTEAVKAGSHPSEVLIANIALYLQSVGEL
jgi:hypothetical protein